jgi:hypothetical protein
MVKKEDATATTVRRTAMAKNRLFLNKTEFGTTLRVLKTIDNDRRIHTGIYTSFL